MTRKAGAITHRHWNREAGSGGVFSSDRFDCRICGHGSLPRNSGSDSARSGKAGSRESNSAAGV